MTPKPTTEKYHEALAALDAVAAELAELRQALTEIDHLVRHEWRLKHHDSAFVLNTIEQVLDDPALAGSVKK